MTEVHYGLGDLSWKQINEFIDFINARAQVKDLYLIIHVTCKGGYVSVRDVFLKILNRFPHELHVVSAQSSAFELLHFCEGPVFIEDYSFGMYHLGEVDIRHKDGMKVGALGKMQKHLSKLELLRGKRFMKDLSFTDKERRAVLRGEDVYFNAERLRELFHYKDGYRLMKEHSIEDDQETDSGGNGFIGQFVAEVHAGIHDNHPKLAKQADAHDP